MFNGAGSPQNLRFLCRAFINNIIFNINIYLIIYLHKTVSFMYVELLQIRRPLVSIPLTEDLPFIPHLKSDDTKVKIQK